MMNHRQVAFDTLVQLARRQSDSAAQRLGHLIKVARDDNQKLALLERYRVEYRQRMHAATSQGLDAMSLQNYRVFLAKLDEAIVAQRDIVTERANEVSQGTGLWQAARRKLKSFTTLSDRFVAEKRALERRREQGQMDEITITRQQRGGREA